MNQPFTFIPKPEAWESAFFIKRKTDSSLRPE
jgi:hypothetical protein